MDWTVDWKTFSWVNVIVNGCLCGAGDLSRIYPAVIFLLFSAVFFFVNYINKILIILDYKDYSF